MSHHAAATPRMSVKTTVAGLFGNILEWYDFALYGFLAVIISELFFPASSQLASLLSTYGVFAIGFLARPVGAWLFGYLGDVYGRQEALQASVVLMGGATVALGLLPTAATVGIWAAVLIVILRLLQGISVGGEFSTSVTYMVERANPKRRGFIGSFANVGSTLGLLLGVGVATLFTSVLSDAAMYAWGWRVPFLLGGVLGMVALLLRKRLPANRLKKEEQRHSTQTPLHEALSNNRKELIIAIAFSLGYAVFFYITLVYLPTFATEFLRLPMDHTLQINTVCMALGVLLIPVMGHVSDRFITRKRFLLTGFLLSMVVAVAGFWWLATAASLVSFAVVQMLLIVCAAVPLGVAPATYVELFPRSNRLTAYSITFNVSLGIFGGTTPLVVTWLVGYTGQLMMPAWYILGTISVSVAALLFMTDRSRQPLR